VQIPLDQVKGYLEQLYVYKPGIAETNIVKELTPTPPPASAVINNPMSLSFLGQLNTSSQLGSTSSVGSTQSPAVQQPGNSSCTPSNIMDMPNVNSFTPVIASMPSSMGSSASSPVTAGQMIYPDVNRDLNVCRIGYETQTPQQRLQKVVIFLRGLPPNTFG
jgi:hypothetical protein